MPFALAERQPMVLVHPFLKTGFLRNFGVIFKLLVCFSVCFLFRYLDSAEAQGCGSNVLFCAVGGNLADPVHSFS